MEAAITKARTVLAVVATIVVAAAMFQTVAPASGEPTPVLSKYCPPQC